MTKLLFVCSQYPYPPTDGAKLRLYNTAKILSRRHTVDLLVVQDEASEDERSHLRSEFNRVVGFSHSKMRTRYNVARGVVSRKPIRAHYHAFGDVDRWIDRHRDEYDLLYANYTNTTEYVRNRDLPKVVDLVDAMSENYLQRAKPSNDENHLLRKLYELEGLQLRRYERAIIGSFDHCFVTTEADARKMTGDGPRSNLTVVPNGVRAELLSGPSDEDGSPPERPRLVFLGRMDYFPNEDAVEHFTHEIFPGIRTHHPDAEFLVVGSHPSERVRSLGDAPNVTVTGFVDDVTHHLSMADVVVAPMRFGTGIQNKILEAMALGKPVVTTPVGAEGIDGESGDHFVVAEEPSAFADAVSALLDSPERRTEVGASARDLVEKQYSWDSVGETLLEAVDAVVDGRDSPGQFDDDL